jgi:hypothetical protein
VDLGLFDELLGEDAVEEAPGEEREEKKRDEGDGDEGDVDPVRERPERMLNVFPGIEEIQDKRGKNEDRAVKEQKPEEIDGALDKGLSG